MKKRILTFILALTILSMLVLSAIPAMASDQQITMRLHYYRPDGNYDGWNVWLWDLSKKTPLNPPYQFEKVGNEMVTTVSLCPGTLEVGYIVRRSEHLKPWAQKDVDADQFIEVAGVMSGTLDVYVKSGVKGHQIVYGPDVVRDTVIVSARYDEENSEGLPQVIVRMSNVVEDYEVTNETFAIFNRDYSAQVTAVKLVNKSYYLTLSEKLDLMRGYMVTFEDEEAELKMPDDIYDREEFKERFTYTGNDLGFTYTKKNTKLRLWAPLALKAFVKLYRDGDPKKEAQPYSEVEMTRDVNGTWVCTLDGDMNDTYYTYMVEYDTRTVEACDPYARSTGVNGDRAMILDLKATNPRFWRFDRNPHAKKNCNDAIIYEMSVMDMSSDASSGIDHKGKYLAFTEVDSKTLDGIITGLKHISTLNVTHVQLMPVYDFATVDESMPEAERVYNWGYDPKNYNVPEGIYATDPTDGSVRVIEFKQMVKAMHDAKLGVIMDVVYNHVYNAGEFCFNQLVPGYFVRPGSNGSNCGNDVASERSMVSKYIVDSVNYWVDEYHIDGFRFDLVGLLDTNTINEIVRTVHEKRPDVIFYGEGWSLGTKTTEPGCTLATQQNSALTPGFGYFNDFSRNAVKGNDSFGNVSAGFISGGYVSVEDLNACFMGMASWCKSPTQCINYLSCHDNHTLFDQITMVKQAASMEERIAINKLGAAFTFMSQGIPFIHGGEEMLRSKPLDQGGFDDNSYQSPHSVNSLKWSDLANPQYRNVCNYYMGLAKFRRAHAALRLTDAGAVAAAVQPITGLPNNAVAYRIQGGQKGEPADAIVCAFNAGTNGVTLNLPDGDWEIRINGEKAGTESLGTVSGTVEVPARSALVLTQGEKPMIESWMIILAVLAVAVAAAVGTVLILKLKKK